MKKLSIYKDSKSERMNVKLLVDGKSNYVFSVASTEAEWERLIRNVLYNSHKYISLLRDQDKADFEELHEFMMDLYAAMTRLRKEHYKTVLNAAAELPF